MCGLVLAELPALEDPSFLAAEQSIWLPGGSTQARNPPTGFASQLCHLSASVSSSVNAGNDDQLLCRYVVKII